MFQGLRGLGLGGRCVCFWGWGCLDLSRFCVLVLGFQVSASVCFSASGSQEFRDSGFVGFSHYRVHLFVAWGGAQFVC